MSRSSFLAHFLGMGVSSALDLLCDAECALDPHCEDKCSLDPECDRRCCALGTECTDVHTRSYCCGGPCYQAVEFQDAAILSGDVALEDCVVNSGVICRARCIGNPECGAWTFWFAGDFSGLCLLWNRATEKAASSIAISGERDCEPTWLAGIDSVEVAPHDHEVVDTPRAIRHALQTEGIAVARGVVPEEALEALRGSAERVLEAILAADRWRVGNRGPRRYSLGSASPTRHWIHDEGWLLCFFLTLS